MQTPELHHKLWRSLETRRWHHSAEPALRNSGDTVAAHSARVAVLMHILMPNAGEVMLKAAIFHDAPECDLGDMSRMAKRKNVALAMELQELERQWHIDHGTPRLPHDAIMLKLCDSLDAILFAAQHAPWVMRQDDWRDHIAEADRLAWALGEGVAAKVAGLLDYVGVR